MKTFIKTYISGSFIKKKVLLFNTVFFTIIMLFFATGCLKEDYPVRLVFPVLTTTPASGITETTAVTGGNITSDGGSDITARGVCWSRSLNPSLAFPDSTTVDGTGSGQFTSTINGLATDKTYHIRAYATNPNGTSYGQDLTFTTVAN